MPETAKKGATIMRFRRVLSAMLLCVLCTSQINVLADAEHSTDDMKINYDFESSLEFTASCAKRTDTEDIYHGGVMEIFPTETLSSSFKKLPGLEKNEKTTVSFDFYAPQTDHIFRMALHDGLKVFSSVYWDHAGRVVFSLNGQEPMPTQKSTYTHQATGLYEANKWHSISMVINPDGVNTTIDYYYDGSYMGKCETNRSETGNLDTLYFTSTFEGYNISTGEKLDYDGNEGLYIDNVRISQGEADFYAIAGDREGYILIEMSEQIGDKNAVREIELINTATSETDEIKEIICEGTKLYILPLERLDAGKEYVVKFPEGTKSVTGKELSENIVYFTSEYGESKASWKPVEPYVFKTDFDNLTPGAAVKNDEEWNKVIAASTINGVSCVDENDNKFVRFSNESGSTYLRFESSGKWTDDASQDRVIVEFDVSLPEIKRSADILFLVNAKSVGQCFFDSYGRFVMVSGDGFDSKEDTKEEYSEKHIVYELVADTNKWYTLSVCIDKKAKTIDYYIDDNLAGQTAWTENIENAKLSAIRVKANPDLADSRAIDFDNFSIAHTMSTDSVSKMRLFSSNGESWGPLASDVIPTVSDGRLEFSCDIDFASVQDEDIVISDGSATVPVSVTDCGSNYVTFTVDRFMKAGCDYTITVQNISSLKGVVMAPYKATFKTSNRKAVDVDNFRLENAEGNEIVSLSDIPAGSTITLKADILNSTDNDVTVRPVLTEVKDNILVGTSEEKFTIPAGERKPVSASLTVQGGTNGAVSAMLTDENYSPMCDAIVLSDIAEAEDDAWTVTYSGRVDSKESEYGVFADVLLPEKKRDDISGAQYLGTVLACRTQVNADEDGNFVVRFRLNDDPGIEGDAVSGEYTIIFSCGKNVQKDIISFSNINESIALTAEINGAAKKENAVSEISKLITNNPGALGIDSRNLEKIDSEKLALMVYNYIAQNGDFAKESDLELFLDKCMVIQLTKEGEVSNLFSFDSELELSESKIGNLYKLSFVTEELMQEITKELAGGEYKTTEDFYKALTEKFVLNAVENPDGTNNVRKVIKELYSEIGIDEKKLEKATDSVYSKIAYKQYASYSALKEAFLAACAKTNKTPSGGGGGGSYSGGVSYSNNVQAPAVNAITPIPKEIFDDLDGAKWAKDAIISLAEKKIISGKDENKFCPNDNITREEFTKLVVCAFLSDSKEADISFEDVDENRWSYAYIRKAYAEEIVSGKSEHYFGASENITRQDMASILYRAALKKGIAFTSDINKRFADEESIPEYAVEAVNKLYNANVVSGMSEGRFEGDGFATRAQAAKMIDALLKL